MEEQVKGIIERKGEAGWLRTQECANEYADLAVGKPWIKETRESRKTKFYRWYRKVKNKKVEGFQVLMLPGNISFIGLDGANPETIETLISGDKRTKPNFESGRGFFNWWERRAERKSLERQRERELIEGELRELDCKAAIRREILEIYDKLPLEKQDEPLPVDQEKAIEKKWRKYYGLE